MIEIGGVLINPDHVSAIVPPVPSLGIPVQAFLISGDSVNIHASFDEVKEALL